MWACTPGGSARQLEDDAVWHGYASALCTSALQKNSYYFIFNICSPISAHPGYSTLTTSSVCMVCLVYTGGPQLLSGGCQEPWSCFVCLISLKPDCDPDCDLNMKQTTATVKGNNIWCSSLIWNKWTKLQLWKQSQSDADFPNVLPVERIQNRTVWIPQSSDFVS